MIIDKITSFDGIVGNNIKNPSGKMLRKIILMAMGFAIAYNSISQQKADTFIVNGRVVTHKEFKSFLATLKELPGTSFRKKTSTGGSSGHVVKDTITGIVYEYVSSVVNGNCKSTITKIF